MPGATVRIDLSAAAANLTAAGIPAAVEAAGAVAYVAAQRASVEVFLDDDGYTEVRWWNESAATTDEVCAIITSAVAAIAGP